MADVKQRFVDWDGLVYYDGKIKQYIEDKGEDYLKFGETVLFADLPAPGYENYNTIYRVSDAFISNSWFIDRNKSYNKNTLVICRDKDNIFLYDIFCEASVIDIPEVDLSNYYNKDEIDAKLLALDLDSYAQKSYVESLIANIPTVDLTGYATEDFVRSEIAKAELNGGEVTDEELENLLANYYKKAEVDALIPDAYNKDQSDKRYALKDELNDLSDIVGNLEIPTKTSDLTNDSGFIDEAALNDALNDLDIPEINVDNYYEKSEVDSLLDAYVTREDLLEDLQDFVTDDDISNLITAEQLEQKGYVTQDTLSNNYATKESVNSALGEVNNRINDIDVLTLQEVENAGFIKSEDVNNYIPKDISSFNNNVGYITAESLDDKADKVHKHSINDVEDYVAPDLSKYALKEDLDDFIKDIPEEYITKDELDAEGFVKSLDGYATEDWVKNQNYLTEHQDISGKADNILFTADKFVTVAIGDFKVGDNVNGLTLQQLFNKLLSLSDNGDTPDVPVEPSTIVDKIIADNIPMYQVNENGDLVEITYTYKTMTMDEATTNPTSDCFYQIKDDSGNILQSGYQHMSDENDSMYYVVVLPKELDFNSNVDVQYWDAGSDQWRTARVNMTSDMNVIEEAFAEGDIPVPTIDTTKYTVWIDSSLEVCAGTDYRFIINE